MSHYTPSNTAIESSRLIRGSSPTLVCPSCGDNMEHFRTIKELGMRPEQLIFVCPSCKEVAVKRYLWRDILKVRREQAGHPIKANHAVLYTTATSVDVIGN